MTDTYRIKALEWQKTPNGIDAFCILGDFSVYKHFYDPDDDTKFWWVWSFCFDEYYNEGHQQCRTMKEGKQRAEALYLERIKQALETVDD